jgi:salicylate hydroxylase
MADTPILIAGAGIGGLTAAIALQQKGFTVAIYEQAPELGEIGAGLQIAANGTRLLIALGLEEEMAAVACEAEYKEVRLWNTGESRKLFGLGEDSRRRFGAPYWFVHRGDLHRVLMNAVLAHDPDCIHPGKRCVGYTEIEDGVELAFEDGGSATGAALIAADGVHSVLRDQAFSSPKAKFTGMLSWRGIAKMEELSDGLRTMSGTNWVGPGGHVVTYPLRAGELFNFVGIVENRSWTSESWVDPGTRDDCRADLAGWNPAIHELIEKIDQPFKWALIDREPLRQWAMGRLILIGDAAHPTLPFLAQGAIMAIEDGVILARCLEAAGGDPTTAFARFEKTRIERCTAIVDGSSANTTRFHNPQLREHDTAIAYLDDQWEPEKVRQRYDWLFEYDATKVELAGS